MKDEWGRPDDRHYGVCEEEQGEGEMTKSG